MVSKCVCVREYLSFNPSGRRYEMRRFGSKGVVKHVTAGVRNRIRGPLWVEAGEDVGSLGDVPVLSLIHI